jgi:DNA-binding response OmpR family regulator
LRPPGIDVVLLDLSLPDSAGLETIERSHSAIRRVPIVALTGLDNGNLALDVDVVKWGGRRLPGQGHFLTGTAAPGDPICV